MKGKVIEVKCYAGYTYAERPLSFIRQGVEYKIEEISNSWREPGEKHFQVNIKNNRIFHLCYNELNNQWSLVESRGAKNNAERNP